MNVPLLIDKFIDKWKLSPFALSADYPWDITQNAEKLVCLLIETMNNEYAIDGDIAIHRQSKVENNVTLKGPIIVGPNCLIASGSYLRGGVFLERDCIIGPNCELKTTFMFGGSKLAHLNFVGDSIIGAGVNIEAGAIVANYRNEMKNKEILIEYKGNIIDTGAQKFGALIGDNVRISANAVVAPGAILEPGYKLARLGLLDQHPDKD